MSVWTMLQALQGPCVNWESMCASLCLVSMAAPARYAVLVIIVHPQEGEEKLVSKHPSAFMPSSQV